MKTGCVFLTLGLLILLSQLANLNAQSWKEMTDPCKFYQEKQDYDSALKWAEEAKSTAESQFGDKDTNYISSLTSLYLCSYYMGQFEKAIAYCEKAKPIIMEIKGKETPEYAEVVESLGVINSLLGMYKEAEPLLKEALAIYRIVFKTDNKDLAITILVLGNFYNNIGKHKETEQLLIEALAMFRRLYTGDNSDKASTILSLGAFYSSLGKYKEAEPFYVEALSAYRRIFKTDHPDLAMCINSTAFFFNAIGEYKKAEMLYKESMGMYRRLFKGDHPNLVDPILSLGNIYLKQGLFKEGELLLIEVLAMCRRIFKADHPYLVGTITSMANYYNYIGNYNLAEPLYIEAINDQKKLIDNYFPSLSESEKKFFWNNVSSRFEAFNCFGIIRFPENPLITCNMYDMQLYTKALLFNSTSKIKKRIMNSNDSELIDKYKQFTDKKELLVKLYTMTEDARKNKGFNLDSIEEITNEFEKELSLKSEFYAQSYDKKKVTWKTIQAVLKPDEAAVEVVRLRYKEKNRFTDTIYYAFLIVTEATEEHPDIVVLENGKALENEYYTDYRMKINAKIEDKLSYIRYWEKLEDKLKGFKKIYYSADGIYNKLNPATLLMPYGKFLLDEQDIQQVNSTKDLLIGYYQTKQESNIYNSAVLIGNPNFSLSESHVKEGTKKMRGQVDKEANYEFLEKSRGIGLTKLPGTEKEINDIEKFLKAKKWVVNSYLGDKALKTTVKSATSPRILHIATHGMFLEDVNLENKETLGFETQKVVDNPLLRSGLFFTGADNYLKSDSSKPAGDENGLLTAYEAMNLDLDKTELVVLSACETGLGEVKNGEGVYGLQRAFQQAGAKTVMMSLWSVNDIATQELMTTFYKEWLSGKTKREAFKNAQSVIRKKFTHPYYWGAFVMVGE